MPKANATLSRFFDQRFRRIAQRLNTPSDGVAVVFGHSDGGDGGSTSVSGGDGTRLTTATFTTPVDAGAPADDVAVVGGNGGYWIFTVRGGELSGEWRCGP